MVGAQQAVFYVLDARGEQPQLTLLASYASERPASASASELELGEGLVGQCALEKQKILLDQRAARLHPHLLRAWATRRR